MIYDVVIVGAGIVGSSIAYRLSKYDMKLLVIEKNNNVADGVSMSNSAIVHAGEDPKDGTLKAKLNVRGSHMYKKLCEDLGAGYRETGAFVVMTDDSQEPLFDDLVRKAREREIPYEVLSAEEARKQEPELSASVIRALSLPTTAVVTPWEVALKELQVAYLNGTEVKLKTELKAVREEGDTFILDTTNGEIRTHYVINAAGLYSDRVAAMIGECRYTITPRRGEYFVLSHEAKDYVHHIIYPMPTSKGKGILAVPTVHENILLGPNAEEIGNRHGVNTTEEGLYFVRNELYTTLRDVPFGRTIRTFAGVRPSIKEGDFVIEKDKDHERFLNLIGIDSPGVASAPAIAEYVEEMLDLPYSIKEKYETRNPFRSRFSEMSPEEKDAYIKDHPEYGKIVCICEKISEGEIIDAINEPLGPRTIKAVKKRLRPGMGKCQGGFCQPLVMDILIKTLGIKPEEVLYDEPGSNIIFREAEQ